MGGKSKPKQPDYIGAAREQGAQERQTALFNTGLNRVNQVGPTSSTTWSLRPGADPNNPQPGDFIQNTQLSQGQQRLLTLSELGGAGAGARAAEAAASGPNLSGLPGLSYQLSPGSISSGFGPSGPIQSSLDSAGQVQGSVAPAGQIQSSLNRSNLPGLDTGYASQRQAVEQALLSRALPQWEQDRDSLETRLKNQGIEQGSEAWNREMSRMDQARNDLSMQAVLAGGAEQSRLADMERATRGQLFGEEVTSGQFTNQAQGQEFGQNLASGQFMNQAQLQRMQELLARGQFSNQAQNQAFTQGLARAEFGNLAQNQDFQQQLAQAGLANQARNQGFSEQTYLNNLPIQQFLQLSGYGSGMAQPGAFYTGAAGTGDYQAAAGQAGAAAQAAAQNRQSGGNALLGTIGTLGGAFLGGPGGGAISKFLTSLF